MSRIEASPPWTDPSFLCLFCIYSLFILGEICILINYGGGVAMIMIKLGWQLWLWEGEKWRKHWEHCENDDDRGIHEDVLSALWRQTGIHGVKRHRGPHVDLAAKVIDYMQMFCHREMD